MSSRSSKQTPSSGKTDADTRIASSLRARARKAFGALLSGFQDADRKAQGALSSGQENAIYPGIVTAVLRLVVVLFAESRAVPALAKMPGTLRELHGLLAASAALEQRCDAWLRIQDAFRRMHASSKRSPEAAALFDPALTPFLAAPLSDAAVFSTLDALFLGDGAPVDFAELDVEHLGTFYEGLMAFDAADSTSHYDVSAAVDLREAAGDARRRLGAHYTSRVITRIVVDRALAPLIASDSSPEALLDLRICDPAMGSGAFLLEACRYLAEKLVLAWDRSGQTHSVCPGMNVTLYARSLVAQKCLYGLDKNPRAAELARWALWLLTSSHAFELPLLDEHLRSGDSLVDAAAQQLQFSRGFADAFHRRHRPFVWEREFPDVFARGGFDAFVGNPPWVSYAGRAAQPLDDDLRKYYMKTNPAFAGYRNLQGMFVWRCATMLRPSGRLGFVLPSSMSELGGYAPTRRAHERLCECDDDLPDFGDVFDDVFQPSMALLSTRRPAAIEVEMAKPWPIHRADLDEAAVNLLARLAALPKFPPELFGERGFQSMGDDIHHLHAQDAPSGALRTGVRVGGDIEPFLRKPPKFYCDPRVFGSRFRPDAEWRSVRLFVRQTARYPMVAPSDGGAFRNSILAGFSSETWSQFFLLAWLNSSPIRWYHYTQNRDARQGMPQVKIAHLRALPAPPTRALVENIENIGRRLGERNAGIAASEQTELDALVADALDLGPAARQIVASWAASMTSKQS
ncbi:MAG: N-6 DNA methylase [Polyangiaceae bacterium]|nr:N-6 DNA methylase [Polyangiaceae bacterium]